MGSRLEKNSKLISKRIESHIFEDEEGEEYAGSEFGGFSNYFRRKKLKLQNLDAQLRSDSPGKPQLFKGVVCHVNGYTQPSLNDLHHLIVVHGGGFMQYLDGKTTVTHVIAANLTPKKAIEFRRYRIVKPAWIVDSVKAGKLLPWDTYRVIDEAPGQRLLEFSNGKITSHAKTSRRAYTDQTSTSWYTNQVQKVVDGIDDESIPQFPSIQASKNNGFVEFIADSAEQRANGLQSRPHDAELAENDPASTGSFEITSSLEEILKNVDAAAGNTVPTALEETAVLKTQDKQHGMLLSGVIPHNGNELPHTTGLDVVFESQSRSKRTKTTTAEEHNALLLADPRMRKSSTANPDFIQQFYSESRLHHLSTWKAELKSRFQRMAAEKSESQQQVTKWNPGVRRYIIHIDFDSFFCAVSLKNAPQYVDKPTVVAHGSSAGSEIASCNYPARAFGVQNGMWMKDVLKLCPSIKVLAYDFPAYEEASREFYNAILDVGGIVQSVSVDEALVDITSLCLSAGGTDGVGADEASIWREQEKANMIAQHLRTRIKEKTGCEVSVGIGGNILIAKVALRKAKPAGQYQIKPEEVLNFIGSLRIQDLPGVAHSIGGKLHEIGVKLVEDVRQLTKERLMMVLGPKTGQKIWDYSRGIDRTEVGEQVVRKSVSADVNWGIRFISQREAEEFVQNLCVELQRRLVDQSVKGRQLTMKIMRRSADAPLIPPKHLGHGKCDVFNKSITLGVPTNSAEIISREAVSILRSYNISPGELRGLGVQMTKLEPLKATNLALPDGSQRRISFGMNTTAKINKSLDYAYDDPQPSMKQKYTLISRNMSVGVTVEDLVDDLNTLPKSKNGSQFLGEKDPIDESSPLNLKTPLHLAAAITRANAADHSARKPLNITGTQFIMPSQADPDVLAELPWDIRAKLIPQSKSTSASRSETPGVMCRSEKSIGSMAIPLPSQLDPEVFAALPEDMKTEVLASYRAPAGPSRARSTPPLSPRKLPTRTTIGPKKRGRPAGPKNLHKPNSNTWFLKSNFIAPRNSKRGSKENEAENEKDHGQLKDHGVGLSTSVDGNDYNDHDPDETPDPDFLSALPEDIRQEVLTAHEHKRKYFAKSKKGAEGVKGNLTTLMKPKRHGSISTTFTDTDTTTTTTITPTTLPHRQLILPARAPRPTFTMRELSSVSQLRDALSAWHAAFVCDGPFVEDVAALERYLRRVVLDERDLSKVVAVVRWLKWLIDDRGDRDDVQNTASRVWLRAYDSIVEKVQTAVQERGLGYLEL